MAGIYQNLNSITTIKEEIKRSISEKGIDMSDIAFSDYPEKIDEIVQSGEYQDGYIAGKEEQKSLLQPISITENGIYQTENGYSTVEVKVNGECPQLESIKITENGVYRGAYNEVDVDVPMIDNYENGYSDGIEYQKSKLESVTITANGTYTKDDGYNKVVVNVQKGVDVSILKLDEFYFLEPMVQHYIAEWESNESRIEDYYRRNQLTSTYMLFENVGSWDSVNEISNNVTDLLELDGVTDLGALSAYERMGEIRYTESKGQYFYGIECTNIITTSNAFKGCNFMLRSLSGLGTSFELPQTVVLPSYNAYEDDRRDSYIMEMVESLYDFIITNKNGVRTSTLQFPFEPNEDIVSRVIEKGWLVTVVEDDSL